MSKSSHVSAHWQLNLYKDINWKEEIEPFSLGGKQIKVTQQQEEIILLWHLLVLIVKYYHLPFFSDCQSLENTGTTFNLLSIARERCCLVSHTKY